MTLPAAPQAVRKRPGSRPHPATLLLAFPHGQIGKVIRCVAALQHPFKRVRFTNFDQRLGQGPHDEQEQAAFLNNVLPLIAALPKDQALNVVFQGCPDAASYRALLKSALGERRLTYGAASAATAILQRVAQHGMGGGVSRDLAHDAHVYITAISDGASTYVSTVLLLPWRVTWDEERLNTADTAAATFKALERICHNVNARANLAFYTSNPVTASVLQQQRSQLSEEGRAAATHAYQITSEKGITVQVIQGADQTIKQLGRMLVARAYERALGGAL